MGKLREGFFAMVFAGVVRSRGQALDGVDLEVDNENMNKSEDVAGWAWPIRGVAGCLAAIWVASLVGPVAFSEEDLPGATHTRLARFESYAATIDLGRDGEVVGEVTLQLVAERPMDSIEVDLGPKATLLSAVLVDHSREVPIAVQSRGPAVPVRMTFNRQLEAGESVAIRMRVGGVSTVRFGKAVFCGLWEEPWLPLLRQVTAPAVLKVRLALPTVPRERWSLHSLNSRLLEKSDALAGLFEFQGAARGQAFCYGRFYLPSEVANPSLIVLSDRPLDQGRRPSYAGPSAADAGGVARIDDGGQTNSSRGVFLSDEAAYREGLSRRGGRPGVADSLLQGGSVSRDATPVSPRVLNRGRRQVSDSVALMAQAGWSSAWLTHLLGPRLGGRLVAVFSHHPEVGPSGVGLVAVAVDEIVKNRAPALPFRNESQLYYEMARQWWGLGVRPETAADAWLAEGLPVVLASMLAEADQGLPAFQDVWSSVSERIAVPPSLPVSGQAQRAWARDHGARVLQQLRAKLYHAAEPKSDRAFLSLLRSLYQHSANGTVATRQLHTVLEGLAAGGLSVPPAAELEGWLRAALASEGLPTLRQALVATELEEGLFRISGSLELAGHPADVPVVVSIHASKPDGSLRWLGRALLSGSGSQPVDFEVRLPEKPKKILANARYEVLARSAD